MRSVAEVADEHADAILALPQGGVAVINADDAHAGVWREAAQRARARVVGFGMTPAADVRAEAELRADGSTLHLHAREGETDLRARGSGTPDGRQRDRAPRRPRSPPAPRCPRSRAGWPRSGRCRAASRSCARRSARRSSTTATTRIPIPSARRSTCSRAPAGSAGWCWATWARSATPVRRSTARSAPTRARPGWSACSPPARCRRRRSLRSGPGRGTSPTSRAWARRCAPSCAAGTTVLVKGSRFMRMERVVDALAGTPSGGGH